MEARYVSNLTDAISFGSFPSVPGLGFGTRFLGSVSESAEITGQNLNHLSRAVPKSYIFFQLDSSGGGALFPAEILAGHAGSRTPVR
jgi:hypothetical protein